MSLSHSRCRWTPARAGAGALALALALAFGPVLPAAAQPEAAGVKAAFVLNFIRFTEWPPARLPSRDAPLSVCVWSNDVRLADAMKMMNGRTVDARPVRVVEVDRVDALSRCHVLFVAESVPRVTLGTWLQRAESLDVLTVGDGENFAASGGMIGLVSDGTRMRFEINDRAVKRSGLLLDAQLYTLGRGVGEAGAVR